MDASRHLRFRQPTRGRHFRLALDHRVHLVQHLLVCFAQAVLYQCQMKSQKMSCPALDLPDMPLELVNLVVSSMPKVVSMVLHVHSVTSVIAVRRRGDRNKRRRREEAHKARAEPPMSRAGTTPGLCHDVFDYAAMHTLKD